MSDLPGELGAVPLVDQPEQRVGTLALKPYRAPRPYCPVDHQPQVSSGVAAPGGGLWLSIALERKGWVMSFSGSRFQNLIIYSHLQEVTHWFGIAIVGLSLTLHYHDLPWKIPRRDDVLERNMQEGKGYPPYYAAFWQGRVFDCGKSFDPEAKCCLTPCFVVVISSFFTTFNFSLLRGLLWLRLHLLMCLHYHQEQFLYFRMDMTYLKKKHTRIQIWRANVDYH